MSSNKKNSTNSPIRYPGGKFRARKLIAEYLPENTESIISPFIGGGSFELFVTDKDIDVQGYDVFWILANFWDALLNHPTELADGMQRNLGKITKEKFQEKQKSLITIEQSPKRYMSFTDEEKISAAVDFIIVNRCSFSGATLSGGFSQESAKTRFTQSNINKIREFHNPHISIEHGDAFEILDELNKPSSLLFLDPPYMLEGSASSLYGISGSLHRNFDHKKLYELVDSLDNPFILTYNDSPDVRKLWEKYKIEEASWSYGMNKSKKSKEIIITGNM